MNAGMDGLVFEWCECMCVYATRMEERTLALTKPTQAHPHAHNPHGIPHATHIGMSYYLH